MKLCALMIFNLEVRNKYFLLNFNRRKKEMDVFFVLSLDYARINESYEDCINLIVGCTFSYSWKRLLAFFSRSST
jgi:hypothetical protein